MNKAEVVKYKLVMIACLMSYQCEHVTFCFIFCNTNECIVRTFNDAHECVVLTMCGTDIMDLTVCYVSVIV